MKIITVICLGLIGGWLCVPLAEAQEVVEFSNANAAGQIVEVIPGDNPGEDIFVLKNEPLANDSVEDSGDERADASD